MSSSIPIDRGIPAPPESAGGRPMKYPWRQMAVGDSFLIEGKRSNKVGGAITYARKRLGLVIRTRTEDAGTRVWRVA